MNISGFRPHAGFYENNRIKTALPEQTRVIAQTISQPQTPKDNEPVGARKDQSLVQKNQNAYDYAQKYEPQTTYEMRGKDSSIKDLDAERAISELQKNQLLKQYQYFVGNNSQTMEDIMIPVFRSAQNFNL